MSNGLWAHALVLSHKSMSTRYSSNVIDRFISSLAVNDPTQTLYQLSSGQQPAAVTVSVFINLNLYYEMYTFYNFTFLKIDLI